MITLELWIDRESHLRHIEEQEATPDEAADYLREELIAAIRRANLQPLIAAMTNGQDAACIVQVADEYQITEGREHDTL